MALMPQVYRRVRSYLWIVRGAVYGTLFVNFGKTYFSESFPELWLFLMAALFIGVVLAFPHGLAGLYMDRGKPWILRRRAARAGAVPVVAENPPKTPTPTPTPPSPAGHQP